MVHELKIVPEYFEEVFRENKNFEIRKNDRDFNVGDYLLLKEFDGVDYTGRQIFRKVGYILEGGNYGLDKEYVIMSLKSTYL